MPSRSPVLGDGRRRPTAGGALRLVSVSAVLGAVLLLPALAGCGGGDAEVEEIDLVSLLPVAEIRGADGEEIGAGGAGGLRRGEGWSYPEERDGLAFSWGLGDRSVMEFTLDRPRALRLAATAWAFGYPQAPRQEVAVRLNGSRLGSVELERSWEPRPVSIVLPRAATAGGVNRLELLYRYSEQPGRVIAGSGDDRPLAVAWADLRLEPAPPRAGEAGSVSAAERGPGSGGGRSLLLPYGSAVSFYLRLPVDGELRVDRVAAVDDGAVGRLVVVTVAGDGPRHATTVSGRGRRSALRLSVPAAGGEPVRLTLRAEADGGMADGGAAVAGGGLRLVAPRLRLSGAVSGEETTAGAGGATGDTAGSEAPAATVAAGAGRRPNVLIYLVDTLRADRLGCYGYERPLTPHVDRLAADGVRFARMVAQTSWTRPAVASLFTGLTPRRHDTNGRKDALPASLPVLAEELRALGYETAGFSTNGNVSAAFGFDRGFDHFVSLPEGDTADVHQLSDRLHETALEWLDGRFEGRSEGHIEGRSEERTAERPFALYLHSSDPHYPYSPREDLRRRWAPSVSDPQLGSMRTVQALRRGRRTGSPELARELSDLYDAEIAFNDETFGALLAALERHGHADSTVVVFLGDHGEEFLEHGGWTHGETLYQEQLAVPLIFRFPDGLGHGRVIDATARQVDVMPTLLDYLGGEPPPGIDGRSLLGDLAGAADDDGRSALAWLDLDGWRLEAIVEGDWKLIHNLRARRGAGGSSELYDLGADPGETVDLSRRRRNWRGYLLASLRAVRLGAGPAARAQEAEIDPELEARLRALGYLR